MYSSQVASRRKDLASLRSKLADARKKQFEAEKKARKAVEALGKVSSPSQFSSRSRDLERAQKSVADCERKVAEVEKDIVRKESSLHSAEKSLDSAQRDQQKKDDRAAEKRRKADLAHIAEMERAQRQTIAAPSLEPHMPARRRISSSRAALDETYDVCLSFAGQQRDYVERIASDLKGHGLKVFYDQDEDIAPILWGKDLGEVLDYVYREGSRLCVMFISADYAEKAWPVHERRSALARAIEEDDYVLPARFDDTELPGLRPTVGYLDLRDTAPNVLVQFVLKKLEGVVPGPA